MLDIGAGGGRNAAALAAQGHRVVAAEPARELRELGERLHVGQDIEWVEDALSDLAILRRRERRFDLILMAAVWMHLDAEQRSAAMPHLVGLLDAGVG